MFEIITLAIFLSIESWQLVIAAATFVSGCAGGFVSAYLGVKVALAEIRVEQKAQGERLITTEHNVRRLENALVFKQPEA